MAVIGILGGMGPMATVDLFEKIVSFTPAKCDQEHIKIIIYNNPKIPSRIKALIDEEESPLPALAESAKMLEQNGVDFILIPCNTAHYWLEDIQCSVNIEVVNMIENAAAYILRSHPELSGKIMLLATEATVKTGLYDKAFKNKGLNLAVPNEEEQRLVSCVIEEVKAGHAADNAYLADLAKMMLQNTSKGIKAYIGGCTEIPLIFQFVEGDYYKFDPTELLAKYAVCKALENYEDPKYRKSS